MPPDTAATASTTPPTPLPPLRFGAFELDVQAGRLRRDGQPVDLAPRPFALLVYLSRNAGRLVSKDELLDAVWGHRHVSDSALKVAVNALRSALGEDPKAPKWLETVARRGYRFTTEPSPSTDPASPPALPEAPRAAGNLPAPEPGLIGREADLAAVRAAMADHRLVTILGPGGVGKTRLALAAAASEVPADGAWLVRLESLADAEPLVATLARTLGLSPEAARSSANLGRALAPLSLRLVLDNAEHLVAPVAELVSALLKDAPALTVLVTSQHPSRVGGEQRLPLAPLAVPPEGADAGLEGYSAMALLLARVRTLQPDFMPDAEATRAAAEICRALDGLPLALELAAARVPLLGLAGVRRRLGERLSMLSQGRRDAAERHRTLRAALDWTCALLEPLERRTLQRLSVLAGSFDAEAAQAVAADGAQADWEVLDALQGLRDKSLVHTVPGTGGEPRFRLMDSVRQYAAEQLADSGDEPAAAERLLRWMLRRLADLDGRFPRMPMMAWLAELRPDVDNLRAALRVALGNPSKAEQAVDLFARSANFWVRAGFKHEGLRWAQAVQPLAERPLPNDLRARLDLALAVLGTIGWVLPPAQGLAAAERAALTFESSGDRPRAYQALYLQAMGQIRLARHEGRETLLARMRALEEPGWSPRERRLGGWIQAFNARDRGDLAAYQDFALDLTAQCRALGDRIEGWVAAFALAQALYFDGRLDAAIELLDHTVDDMRSAGCLREYATFIALNASFRLARDQSPETVARARDAVQMLQSDGMLWWMADALVWLPAGQGRWVDAARVQGWADGHVRRLGEPRGRIFGGLRERMARRLAERPEAADLSAQQTHGESLTDAEALALVFAGS